MSKQAPAPEKTKARNLKAVDGGVSGAEPKPAIPRVKKPRVGNDFNAQLRALAESHRGKLTKLVDAENKLERKLNTVRAAREAAEAPLRDVERILADRPGLPGLESTTPPQSHVVGGTGVGTGGEIIDTNTGAELDMVNQ